MDGKTLGERVARARVDLDLTQEHLANRVGIERTALGRIEKGERKVSAVELVELAAALGVPLAWFVRDPLPAVVSRRTDAAPSHEVTAGLDRQLELFSGDVAALLATGVIAGEDRERVWRLPRDHTEAETTAAQVRKHLGASDTPLLDLARTAERFGLYSCSLPLGAGGADGALVEVAGGVAAAVIDGDPKVGRRRMSLAHELGHWLFGDPYDVGAQDAERMINSFAAHFLAPRSGVTMAWGCDPSRSVRDKAVFVAGAFRMSWTAAILHLRNLNLITDTDYRALETRLPVPGEFAKLGITLNADELKAPSLSPGITAAIIEAYVDRRMSAARATELLRGSLAEDELPEQRIESAADYVSL
ncbi:XRE family transcriptional regulator [Gordonia sp. (in: high G+C Gram-positive bacteria)]|jgi:transcriptional regulator with XRE-family HTH domain|uniref:helix-turn-helix domain-containing protein n=3 Tax=Gordonia sp. (in: high G+C Gram-positive bacteria) TaxID=84139 RepID=UPI002601775D|nr:XRE family transcriptional regulator [Gordonia sp. (in: high G+C Gram-positive bacteria)]HMS73940.1 XRE family transcriptional regulator [Gordonia sp. (in: high G+C Gram-positive bacteria)]HQV16743.1 XRE family transcriptional regulator [Gordonia sp. (in: high G+C Gram-positive bacteria)]